MRTRNRTYTIGGTTYDSPTQVAIAFRFSGISLDTCTSLLHTPRPQLRDILARDYPDLDAGSIKDLASAVHAYCADILE